ncbi:MAG: hypothetical protein KAT13_05195 [Methanosarcinales archaeon]|nr:hypothetical protein [Methanosarcinales archaeon]MCK4810736.1 hypothetical protein [Methanosarcinales archaeon]
MPRRKVEEMPEEFETYEDAAEFWDTHDSTEYDDVLEDVAIEVDIQKRHYLIEMDADSSKVLHENARKQGIPDSVFASELLQKQLVAMGTS